VAQTLERLWGSDAVEVARGVLQLVGGVDVVEQQLPILLPQALFDQQLDARGEMKDRVLEAARRVELELFDRRGEKVEGVLEQGELEVTVVSSTHAVTVASLRQGGSRASEKGWRNGAVAARETPPRRGSVGSVAHSCSCCSSKLRLMRPRSSRRPFSESRPGLARWSIRSVSIRRCNSGESSVSNRVMSTNRIPCDSVWARKSASCGVSASRLTFLISISSRSVRMSGIRNRAVPLADGMRGFRSRTLATRSPSRPVRLASRWRIRARIRRITSSGGTPASAAAANASANSVSIALASARMALRKRLSKFSLASTLTVSSTVRMRVRAPLRAATRA